MTYHHNNFSYLNKLNKIYKFQHKYTHLILITLILIFFAFAPLFWFMRFSSFNYLGSGDFLSPININLQGYNQLFTYSPYLYGGMDTSFLIAQNIPFYPFYIIANYLGLSSLASTLIIIFSLLLLAEASMFLLIRNTLLNVESEKFETVGCISLFGAIIYALSPYVIGLIEPGHFLQLLIYATLPIILILVNNILTSKGYLIKDFVLLFILFFLNSSAFANFGLIYVTLIILTLYYFSFSIIYKTIFKNAPKYFFIMLLPFLSNIWWLLPFFSNLRSTIQLNQASSSLIQALNIADAKSTILNLFIGRGEGLLFSNLPNNLYNSPLVLIIPLLLILFMFNALLKVKNKKILIPFLVLIISGIFISKGSREPFGDFFLFLYDHFPGFQIFRRPVSKFYWVYLLALMPLASVGIVILLQKIKQIRFKIVIYIILILSMVYMWVLFSLTPTLTPFNIPKDYYVAENDLTQANINKLLIIPGFFGTYPTYNASFNHFYGYDFLNYIWKFSQLIPDNTAYSPNLPYKKITNEMMSNIRTGKSICKQANNLGVTQIMVRQDIDLATQIEDNPNKILEKLSDSSEISSIKKYSDNKKTSFTVFQINKECIQQKSVILNNSSKNIEFNMDSPVKYEIKLKNVKGGEILTLLNNFNPNWNIYLNYNPIEHFNNLNHYKIISLIENIKDISLLNRNSYNNRLHIISNGFANGWKIDINEFKKLGNIQLNSDGTYNLNLIIYYKTQLYFYIGIIIFLLELLGIVSYMIYFLLNKHKN